MNVLSIDFDIIMGPDISLYNHLVDGGGDEERTLAKMCENHPFLNYCRADLHHYAKIVNFITQHISHLTVKDIRVAHSHEDIKYMLDDCNDAHVFNIDHHHDLGYPPPPGVQEQEEEVVCTCANWGDFYFNKGIISHFTWIKNTNSDLPAKYSEDSDNRVTFINFNDFDLNIDLPKIDKLFICLSPEWSSENYFPLFYLLLDLINSQKNCHLELH